MESVSSEDDFDQLNERFESYSLSADVSESESSSSFSRRRDDRECVSSSLTSSPLAGPESAHNSSFLATLPVMPPVVGGRHVVIPVKKTEKPEAELSG